MDKAATARNPLHPIEREFLQLETPIHNSRNAAKVVTLLIESLLEDEHPLASAHINGSRAFLWHTDDVEALRHAVYQLDDLSKRMADDFYDVGNRVAGMDRG